MQNPDLKLYSINCKGIKEAASDLINHTAESLIRFIYSSVLNKTNGKDDGVFCLKQKDGETQDPPRAEGSEGSRESDEPVSEEAERQPEVERLPKDSPYTTPEIRIGLAIRILVKSDCYFSEDLIELILQDIETLRHDTDYLLSFPDPKARRAALEEEYALVQSYIDLDDTLSLNQEIGEDTVVPSRGMYQMAEKGNCMIQ